MNFRHVRGALIAFSLIFIAAPGSATTITLADTEIATETYSLNTGSGGFSVTHSPTALSLPQFDASLGTLQNVAFDFSSSTYTDTARIVDQAAAGSPPVRVQVRGLTWSVSADSLIGGTLLHAGAAGFDDFGFGSCGFCTVVSPGETVTHSAAGALPLATTLNNFDVSDFIGTGTFVMSVIGSTFPDGALGFQLNGFTLDPGPQFGLFIDAELQTTVVGKVTYTFDPVTAAVPEPGTLALCAAGGLVTAVRRRRARMR
jgi:hypothetical protein